MAIRLPLTSVGQFTESNELGVNSVAGGIAHTFQLPLDTDNVVVKFTGSVAGAGVSTTFQTTDDGGVTWYDVARTSIVSNGALPEWLSIPIAGTGARTSSIVATGSVIAGSGIGNAAASTLSSGAYSGLPVLASFARVFTRITGNVTSAASNSNVTTVYVNSQSASHN